MNNIFSSTNFSRWMSLFMSLCLAALLAACGGGGDGAGKVGLPTGVALYTNAPGTVTLAALAQSTFTIGGGTPTYSAASSDKNIATASVSGTSLTIVGVGAGNATVTVTDAVGAAVNVAITINAPPQPPAVTPTTLFTTAAGTVTVGVGASSTYTVGGGVPAYAVSSSNPLVATATLSGTSFSVTGVGAGSAQVVLTDAAGTALGVAVTVGAASPRSLFTTAPSDITLAVDAAVTFAMGGGQPPYSATSGNAGVARVATNGGVILITGVSQGATQVALVDGAGDKITLDVAVGTVVTPTTPPPLFTTAPTEITVAIGANATFAMGGGQGPYSASSSNASVARVATNGNAILITGVGRGAAQIVLADSTGAKVTVAVTVGSVDAEPTTPPLFTTAPSEIAVAVGASTTFTIGGGRAPYSAASGNAGVARVATNGGAILITGTGQGTTQVALVDAAGDKITLTVTVGTVVTPTTPTPLFTTAPTEVTVAIGANATFAMGGGQAPYSASSSNAAVASVVANGSAIVITGVSKGAAQIVLADSAGAKVTVAVTAGSADTEPTTPPLFTTAPSEITVAVDASATFAMGGGQAPYSASSSNMAVAKVAINGSAIVITGIGQGAAQIVLADSAGATITVGVTVGPPTAVVPLFTTAPEALALTVNEVGNYTIGGGKPAYSLSTSNGSVASVAINGSAFTITAIAPGTARVTVTDTVGTTRVIDATVTSTTPPPPVPTDLTVSPGAATGNVGDTLTFLVSGGTPNYTLFMNNTSIASIESGGSGSFTAFTVRLNNVGDTSATITDAAGKIISLPITVNQTSTSLRLSPNALLVGENSTGALALNIYGGTGPYRAFTSDETLSSVIVTGSVLTVGLGSNTNRCINPITSDGTYIPHGTFDVTVTTLDSLGASATSVVTIKDNGRGIGAGCPTPP